MTIPSPSMNRLDRAEERERLLAAALDRLLACSETPDWDAVRRQSPELVDELRELWATAAVADDFASVSAALDALPEQTPTTGVAMPENIDEFELLEELGRGGMGVVFKARQRGLNRVVALKMILRGELAGDVDLARFRAEAEAAARMNHPHIVPVFEVGEYRGQPFFTMQFIEGETLSQRLQAGPLPPSEAAQLLAPVCRAVAEAHRQGILHRDLKPSNILIDEERRPYVTDFGLTKQLRVPEEPGSESSTDEPTRIASVTRSGAIVGTPGYMSPEQAAGDRGDVGPAADVYGLGALLYAMLTGRAPFQAASPLDTVLMLLEQDPLPPRLLNRKCNADLEMIALKCLQKPPDLRYTNADELADDLERFLAGEPVSARSSRITQVVARLFRETHHAAVLENWGLLWMWHGVVLLGLCVATNWLQWRDVTNRWPYVGLWTVGSGIWAGIFWGLRRRAGPTMFVERQIAHVWGASMLAVSMLFAVEALGGLPVLALSPVLALIAGMVFLIKAGTLTGGFYVQAVALFATGAAMAWIAASDLPHVGITVFGVVSGLSFFVPGWKYHRQRRSGD